MPPSPGDRFGIRRAVKGIALEADCQGSPAVQVDWPTREES